ncbi:MAG: cohesin domain-containing protein [Minisyncoccia bacterium]
MSRYCFLLVLLLLPFPVLGDATLYVSPERGSYSIGEAFTISIFADTGGAPVSAAESELSFDANMLSVESLSIASSILGTFSTTPIYVSETSRIRFAGWTRQNFSGSQGLLMTITFKALRNGAAEIKFLSGAVLAADGRGSNIVSTMKGGLYTIGPKQAAPDSVSSIPLNAAPQVLGAATELLPPDFIEYSSVVNVGESIRVRGSAAPDSKVSVHVLGPDGYEERSSITTFSDGMFSFASDPVRESGVYRVYAETQDENGTYSESSERLVITAKADGLAATFAGVISLLPAIVPFLALILSIGLIAGFMVHRSAAKRERDED